MATPLREDTQEISLSLSSTSHFLTHTHTLALLFFHCQPFLFVSLHYFLFLAHCPSPPLLASPLAPLSTRLSPLLRYLFILSPPASHLSGECKYVISLIVFISLTFVWSPPTHSEDLSGSVSPPPLSRPTSETQNTFVIEVAPLFLCPLQLKGRFTGGISQRAALEDSFNKGSVLHRTPFCTRSLPPSLLGRWLAI